MILQRPVLIARNILANRERPDLEALSRVADPEEFVWEILPHAARTFSAAIAMLPKRAALPAAVAYLYCRMLDSYEDLVLDRHERAARLVSFGGRFRSGGSLAPAPLIYAPTDRDLRDKSHLLLVERAELLDRVFLTFDVPTRVVIADLVRDMAEGMRWSSATFAAQGGVLESEAQLATYCR